MSEAELNEIRARCEAAITEEDWEEPVYGSSTYVLVTEDIPKLLTEIESLKRQFEHKQRQLEWWADTANACASLYDEKKAEIVRLKAERDAAVEDLKMVCTCGEPCAACKHCRNQGDQFPCAKHTDWCKGEGWQWRGAKEESK